MAKKKRYIPKQRHNPEKQAIKIEKNRKDLLQISKAVKALSASHDNHILYLGNFARHDIKNSIQSMDSILSTTNSKNISDENIFALKANLKVIRDTIENFSKLVPYSKDQKFNLKNLIIAIELLSRNDFYKNKIILIKELNNENEIFLNLPFQSVLQMFNNLIINSIKALENIENPFIKISLENEGNFVIVKITDNGKKVEKNNQEKIFDFGFSTTGGSGIGLYHAKYLCELFNGKIELKVFDDENLKSFLVYLPIIK